MLATRRTLQWQTYRNIHLHATQHQHEPHRDDACSSPGPLTSAASIACNLCTTSPKYSSLAMLNDVRGVEGTRRDNSPDRRSTRESWEIGNQNSEDVLTCYFESEWQEAPQLLCSRHPPRSAEASITCSHLAIPASFLGWNSRRLHRPRQGKTGRLTPLFCEQRASSGSGCPRFKSRRRTSWYARHLQADLADAESKLA